jgi:leucyl aminopeptidase
MRSRLVSRADSAASLPLWLVTQADWPDIRTRVSSDLGPAAAAFAQACGFDPRPGTFLALPAQDGGIGGALFGIEDTGTGVKDPFLPGRLADLLPAGRYRFANLEQGADDARLAALAFACQAYRFARYRTANDRGVHLTFPDGVDEADLARIVDGVFLARDLINTPANDMGPAELEAAARDLAKSHGAVIRSIVGNDLLVENFPLIHAVGRASVSAPRLIDMTWGDESLPKVTLVGKGVCFDTGGLDIKPDNAMLIMKKDMAGAATVLGLAHMIMDRGLKVRLRVLIPAVENSIAGNAFRPLDIYRSRKGITVEIGNTDAEGRLVLADALALADEEKPELLVDMGTLTGAARVALGPELPPFYTDDDAFAADVARHGAAENDPLWRLPLWRPYEAMLDSRIADTNNVGAGGFAGSITCALFIARFVTQARTFAHFDIYGWVPKARAGRPEGGECQAARALYALLCARYG